MTFTTKPAPTGANNLTVRRLAAVVSAVSSRCAIADVLPWELEQLLSAYNITTTVGRGQPHTIYGTRAVTAADYDRIVSASPDELLAAMGREQ